jgi:peptidoglycan/xylan/chitin deacetylase (PgdA/CDA1 family)
MFIEQPPFFFRMLFPGACWRIDKSQKQVYLTFDDGPIPEVTPWVLDVLDSYQIKACFFCVGDNVKKYPDIYRMIIDRGHQVGNHTYSHLHGWILSAEKYQRNVDEADALIGSRLFRPPHGHLPMKCFFQLKATCKIIMWDVVTRDYSKRMTAKGVFNVVRRYTRPGSIIVFHDSMRSWNRLQTALPKSIEWLKAQGYSFGRIDDE